MSKYNAGQKGYYWYAIVTGLLLLLTGLPLWFPSLMSGGWEQAARLLHHVIFLLTFAGFIIHVYLVTAMFPGTISSMTSGTVSRRWAAWHHPAWFREHEDKVVPRSCGGAGCFGERYARACVIEPTAAIAAPLGLLTAVLAHQEHRASQPEPTRSAATVAVTAEERRTAGRYPLLDLSAAAPAISSEAGAAVTTLTRIFPAIVPEPLVEAGLELSSSDEPDRRELVESWLDDPTLLDPRLGFWIGVAAAPILETAAAGVAAPSRSEWNGVACPICGGPPQASVIAEESGEFMAGSPRNLVCSRCATWWAFARAVCPTCGEDDSRRIAAFLADEFPWARVDACETCHTYLKGFDFRQPGARDVIPLVDDRHTGIGFVGRRSRLPSLESLSSRSLGPGRTAVGYSFALRALWNTESVLRRALSAFGYRLAPTYRWEPTAPRWAPLSSTTAR